MKAERFSGAAVEQAFDLRHRRRVNCSKVRPLWEEVPNQAIRVLVHSAFPRVIGRGKEDVRLQAVRRLSVPSKLFAVVVGDRMDVVAQRCQPTHRGAVRRRRRRASQFRDGGEQAFAFDMGEQRPLVMSPHDGVAFPVAESGLCGHDRRPLRDVGPMRNHATSSGLSPAPVIALAPSA